MSVTPFEYAEKASERRCSKKLKRALHPKQNLIAGVAYLVVIVTLAICVGLSVGVHVTLRDALLDQRSSDLMKFGSYIRSIFDLSEDSLKAQTTISSNIARMKWESGFNSTQVENITSRLELVVAMNVELTIVVDASSGLVVGGSSGIVPYLYSNVSDFQWFKKTMSRRAFTMIEAPESAWGDSSEPEVILLNRPKHFSVVSAPIVSLSGHMYGIVAHFVGASWSSSISGSLFVDASRAVVITNSYGKVTISSQKELLSTSTNPFTSGDVVSEITWQDGEYLTASSPAKFGEFKWTVHVKNMDSDTQHTLFRMQAIIWGTAAGLIISLCFVIVCIISNALAPLNSLSHTANEIATCIKENSAIHLHPDELSSDNPNQIGKLVRSVAEMVESVLSHREELQKLSRAFEARVSERTSELTTINQELEMFSAAVSHDLRAPLASILAATELLETALKDDLSSREREYVTICQDAANRGLQLIQDLLSLSRISHMEVKPVSVNISDVCRTICNQLKHSQHYTEGRTFFNVSNGLEAYGDPGLLRIALENLLNNALKYSSKVANAMIEVGSEERPTGTQTFFVRDNGVGFDMHKASKLFQPFQRMHTDSDFKGTGIGLTTVRRIIVKHNGRIWVQSAPGRGSTFYFTLPMKGLLTSSIWRTSAQQQAAAPPTLTEAPGQTDAKTQDAVENPKEFPEHKLHILVVDDQLINRKLAQRMLEHQGHEVVTVETAAEAIDLALRTSDSFAAPETMRSNSSPIVAAVLTPDRLSAENPAALMGSSERRFRSLPSLSPIKSPLLPLPPSMDATRMSMFDTRVSRKRTVTDLSAHESKQEARVGSVFDVILMDISMPDMDGIAATKELRRRGYVGRIIALTAHEGTETKVECLAAGMDGFISKPFSAKALMTSLGSSRRKSSTFAGVLLPDKLSITPSPSVTQLPPLKESGRRLSHCDGAQSKYVVRVRRDSLKISDT